MKNYEVYDFLEKIKNVKPVSLTNLSGIEDISDFVPDPYFMKIITENKRIARQYIDDLEQGNKPSDQYIAFGNEYNQILEKNARKVNGEPVFEDYEVNGQTKKKYDIPGSDDPKSAHNKEITELKKKYSSVIESEKIRIKKFNKLILEGEAEINLKKIDIKMIPKGLSMEAWEGIDYILKT